MQNLYFGLRRTVKERLKKTLASFPGVRRKLVAMDSILQSAIAPGRLSGRVNGSLPFGLNISGFFSGDFGVAEAARSDARSAMAAGIPLVLNDVDPPGGRSYFQGRPETSEDNPYLFNLVHVNAEQAHEFFMLRGKRYMDGRYNIGYWVWELSDFPEKFASSFGYFHEIWTPSLFSANAIAALSPVPVTRMPHAVSIPEGIAGDKVAHGMEGKFVFLFMFDFHSGFERKNPMGLIRAFKKAFGEKDGAALLIKYNHAESFPAEFKRLLDEGAGNKNIKLIGGRMSREEALHLIASCDCYISLHRSEGFGLTIAEAMALGKPVIATGYSGNMDFMDSNNSFPVKYKIVELEKDFPPYDKGSVWAEPDIGYAAKLMRELYENRDAALEKGRRAMEDMERNYSPAAVGNLYGERLELVYSHITENKT